MIEKGQKADRSRRLDAEGTAAAGWRLEKLVHNCISGWQFFVEYNSYASGQKHII